MTQKGVDEMIIGLTARMSVVKMVEIFCFVLEIIEIDGDGINTEIDLIK